MKKVANPINPRMRIDGSESTKPAPSINILLIPSAKRVKGSNLINGTTVSGKLW